MPGPAAAGRLLRRIRTCTHPAIIRVPRRYNAAVSRQPVFVALRNAPLHGFTRLLIFLASRLPARLAFSMGGSLAALAWAIQPRWRRTARRNMELLWHGDPDPPSKDPRWCARMGKLAAVNLGYEVIEFMRMGTRPVEEGLGMVVETEGLETLRQMLAAAKTNGSGVILMGMHIGNWELSGAYLASRVGTIYAVGKIQRDSFFTDYAFRWRERYGMRALKAGDRASSGILRPLKEGAMLGLISDQNGGRRGLFAPFGAGARPLQASSVPGAAALTLRTGCPVLPAYTVRLAPGRLKFIAGPPVDMKGIAGHDPQSGRYSDAALIEAISRINTATARIVAAHPDQWLWGHKRWKTRPPGEPSLY